VKKLIRGPNRMDGRGEEVLERHLFQKHKESAASDYHPSALLPRALAHNPNVRILKLRKPDRPSGCKQEKPIFSQLQGDEGRLDGFSKC